MPEKFWTNEQNPGEGVSAVKALAKAAAEGQKIYTLTGQNASVVYQIQVDDAIRSEIQNALNAGKTVTVHERPITVSGWSGTGYIIADPATGAGAFKISGGANGGWLLLQGFFAGILLPAMLFLMFSGGLLTVLSVILAILLIIYTLQVSVLANAGCYFGGFGIGFGTLFTFGIDVTFILDRFLIWLAGISLALRTAAGTSQIEECLEF